MSRGADPHAYSLTVCAEVPVQQASERQIPGTGAVARATPLRGSEYREADLSGRLPERSVSTGPTASRRQRRAYDVFDPASTVDVECRACAASAPHQQANHGIVRDLW